MIDTKLKFKNGFTPHLKVESMKTAKGNRLLSAGFTLVEIIIAMGILSGLILAISIFSFDVFDFGIFLGENITSQQEIQLTPKSDCFRSTSYGSIG
jgi:prepilin-type N-terminal cleavage/methylation domain-containing protein